MEPLITYSLFKLFEKDNISFIYQGNFTNLVLGMATDLIKNHLETDKNLISLRNKLSFLMIESFQNIVRYADSNKIEEYELSKELFLTRNIGDNFHIITANLIENKKIGYVKEKLSEVNDLTESELKQLYIKILTNRKISEAGGAGLGFIEMVRKTNEKLDFDFVPVNEEVSFFYFQLNLKNSKADSKTQHIPISETKTIHKIISEENILLIHKGNFNQEAIKPVLVMAENNIQSNENSNQKLIFHLMVEAMQNISKHAYNKNGIREGIFTLSKKNDNYILCTGNFIDNSNLETFKKYLNNLSQMSKLELNTYYKKILREGSDINDNNGGLGLIDILRECYGNVKYEFYPIDNGLTFFSLTMEI